MSFGSTKDYFGLATTGEIELQSDNKNPSFATEANGEDSNGDVVCTTKSGETIEVSSTYTLCGGGDTNNQHNLDTHVEIGMVKSFDTVTHYQITSIDLSTDNKAYPTLTVTGVQDTGTTAQTHARYSTGLTFLAKKKAQGFGLGTIASGDKVISGGVAISGSVATVADSDGNIVKREPYGVRITATNTLQNCTADPSTPVDAAWGEDTPEAVLAESNTDYATATVTAFKNVTQDA